MDKIKVVELFAGVGGFKLGLEGYNGKSSTSGYKDDINSPYKVIWSNQWEPSTKTQHASMVYKNRFSEDILCNEDINNVDVNDIPECDLLVGGFPCQDYSVASTSNNSKGIEGKKGVLWWNIHKILFEIKNKPKYLLFENVDRLLLSPSKQRGRDFAIILKSLDELGYSVEWRVINAAEYGFPQRRKRIFIMGYLKDTLIYNKILESNIITNNWVLSDGVIANAFPICNQIENLNVFELNGNILDISNNFKTDFQNTGIMINGVVVTLKSTPFYNNDKNVLLGDILEHDDNIPNEYYINDDDLKKWVYLKGSKKFERTSKDGFKYTYSEGSMTFPDKLENPSRTIITGEGGNAPSRFKHVIKTEKGYRRLTPIELERLTMFPDNHTKLKGVSDTKRAFFVGNALVVGIIEKLGVSLYKNIKN